MLKIFRCLRQQQNISEPPYKNKLVLCVQDEESSIQEQISAPGFFSGAFAIGEGRNNPATIIVKIMKSTLMVLFKVTSLNRDQSKSLKGNL